MCLLWVFRNLNNHIIYMFQVHQNIISLTKYKLLPFITQNPVSWYKFQIFKLIYVRYILFLILKFQCTRRPIRHLHYMYIHLKGSRNINLTLSFNSYRVFVKWFHDFGTSLSFMICTNKHNFTLISKYSSVGHKNTYKHIL